jgi:hypothetical protein
MTQFEIIDLFKLLGFKCLEDNVGCEVDDFGYYSRFGNETHEIQFRNRNGELQISIVKYSLTTNNIDIYNSFRITPALGVAIVEQTNFILDEYKGEIK